MGLVEELEERIKQLEAELWVARDSALRTYDGLAQKADMADELAEALKICHKYASYPGDGHYELGRVINKALAKYKGEK
jgi:hypothetical protein